MITRTIQPVLALTLVAAAAATVAAQSAKKPATRSMPSPPNPPVAAAKTRANEAIEGRVVLRRLNRTEYENTVRELLAVDTELKELLPEDATSGGFDNIGEALTISPVLMERYLEAADAALDDAVVLTARPAVVRRRFSYKDERNINNPRIFFQRPDAVVFYSSSYSPTALMQFRAPAKGRYRFRISAYGYQSNRPVTLRVYGGQLAFREGKSHLIGYYDVPPDRPTVLELEDQLNPLETIQIVPYDTGHTIYQVGAENYREAGLAVQWVEVEGPLTDAWPPESHRRLLGDIPLTPLPVGPRTRPPRFGEPQIAFRVSPGNPAADAERILREFVPRAFRRPVADAELRPYLDLARSRLDQQYEFVDALGVALKAVLCSPEFLFLKERPHPTAPRIDDYALASRLSYFLWSSMPDHELLDLAAKGELGKATVLQSQVERMLKSPKSAGFTHNFVGQWLGLRDIDFTTPDQRLYPEYDELLRISMIRETELFFDEVLKNNLSLLTFINSDFTMLNERLAKHYDIRGVNGQEFRRVKLQPEQHRGGVLTQASVLKVTANGTSTSPVMRGVWVMKNLLGRQPSPPPAGVPAIEPDIRGTTTIREQLAKHRESPACAGCHAQIDPPGFALECFDVIGGWRDFYRSAGNGPRFTTVAGGRPVAYRRGPAVDAKDVMSDGRRFRDIEEFKQLLLSDRDQVTRCLTEKLLTYATGAPVRADDQPAVDGIVAQLRAENYGFRKLVHAIVQSGPFRRK